METSKTTVKKEAEQELGLLECTQMFANTMENKYFDGPNDSRSLIILATDGDNMHSCLFGKGDRVINMLATAMDSSEKFKNLVMAAFVTMYGSKVLDRFNPNDNGNE